MVFAATADPSRLVESVAKFVPHLIVVFAQGDAEAGMMRIGMLRDQCGADRLPIVLASSGRPRDPSLATAVVPEPSDASAFALHLMKLLSLPQVGFEDTAAEPREAQLGEEGESEEGLAEIAEVEEIPLKPGVVLVVDDDPTLVKLFGVVLKKSGFEVFCAEDGEAGLATALAQRPDLIVADLDMPVLDGWGLLRALRADHRVAETPVLVLSAHDDYRESLKALAAGAQDYVAKGGKLEHLVGRVRSLLAPRDAFADGLSASERISSKIEEVGVQWAVRAAARSGVSGMLHLKDPFWRISLAIADGQLTFATSELGTHRLTGEAALPPLVVLRTGELLFEPHGAPPEENLRGHAVDLLEAAALRNNQNEDKALERLLVSARRVEVDEDLYQLYAQLGPQATREIAALFHEGLTPREVIARGERSPTDVEDTLRDLVRRGVLRLTA